LVGLLGRGIGQTQGLYLHTQDNTTQKNADTHPSGFESRIPVFDRPKTVRASDCSATRTGVFCLWSIMLKKLTSRGTSWPSAVDTSLFFLVPYSQLRALVCDHKVKMYINIIISSSSTGRVWSFWSSRRELGIFLFTTAFLILSFYLLLHF